MTTPTPDPTYTEALAYLQGSLPDNPDLDDPPKRALRIVVDRPAKLWLVTNPWLGNGNEGVIVECDGDMHAAAALAEQALREHWTKERSKEVARSGEVLGAHQIAHCDEHLASYDGTHDGWSADEITLPYIGEFS